MLRRNRGKTRSIWGAGIGVGHDFNVHAVRIRKSQHLFVEPFSSALDQETLVCKPFMPIFERRGWNAEGSPDDFAGAGVAASAVRPREKGEDGTGRAGIVAEVEVIGPWIVKVDRALDETQSQDFGVKVQVCLRIGSDCSNVVETGDGAGHIVIGFRSFRNDSDCDRNVAGEEHGRSNGRPRDILGFILQ